MHDPIPTLVALASRAQSFDPLGKGVAFRDDGSAAVSAASRRWKARFAPEGTSFVPWFGSEMPRSLPLTFCLESITAGGLPLQTAGGAVARTGSARCSAATTSTPVRSTAATSGRTSAATTRR